MIHTYCPVVVRAPQEIEISLTIEYKVERGGGVYWCSRDRFKGKSAIVSKGFNSL